MSKNNQEEILVKKVKGKNRMFFLRTRTGAFISLLLLAAIVVGAYYAYAWYTSPENTLVREEKRNKEIVLDLRKIILLPSEEPAIYDIQDPILLMQSQPFFAGSQEGDKLIIFTQTAKAIIYSPDRDVIVNIGPVTADPSQQNAENMEGQPVIGSGAQPASQMLGENSFDDESADSEL
jgi:hypothetical protein